MKRKVTPIIILCFLFASLMILQINAVEPRSYLYGCTECGGDVVAFCDGFAYSEETSHKYNKVLGIFGGNTCIYTEIYHYTTDYCDVTPTHVYPGDTVMAMEGHTYDDVGENACGIEDTTPCPLNSVAYRSYD